MLLHYDILDTFPIFSFISDLLGSNIIDLDSGSFNHSYSGVSKNAVSL